MQTFEDVLYEALSDSKKAASNGDIVLEDLGADIASRLKSAGIDASSSKRDSRKTVTTYEVVDWADVPESVRHHFRRKALAAKSGKKIDPKKTTCMLYLQADHLFHEQMGTEEATIDVMTRHVQRVNGIYKDVGKCRTDVRLVRNFSSHLQVSYYMQIHVTPPMTKQRHNPARELLNLPGYTYFSLSLSVP